MAAERGKESTSKQWLQKIKVDHLKLITTPSHCLEMKSHQLINIFYEDMPLQKEEIINSLILDEDVLFSWIFASKELDNETTSELLHQIIELWLTIQEFSAVGSWMKYYK